ncbi:MAG: ABC transporter permease [Candidatus Eisenbacteria sp.]|nr:ABC transporter permease [Candidatus Eisenbacteria bacterium]
MPTDRRRPPQDRCAPRRPSRGPAARGWRQGVLALLGVALGVASLVAGSALRAGLAGRMAGHESLLSWKLLYLVPGGSRLPFAPAEKGPPVGLTSEDAAALVEACPAIHAAVPIVAARLPLIAQGAARGRVWVEGRDCEGLRIEGLHLESGRFFTPEEVSYAARVCLTVADPAGGRAGDAVGGSAEGGPDGRAGDAAGGRAEDAVGGRAGDAAGGFAEKGAGRNVGVALGAWFYEVIGAVTAGSRFAASSGQRPHFFVPVSTLQKQLGRGTGFDALALHSRDRGRLADARAQVDGWVRSRFRLDPQGDAPYVLTSRADLLGLHDGLAMGIRGVTLLLAGVGFCLGGCGMIGHLGARGQARRLEFGMRLGSGAPRGEVLLEVLAEAAAAALAGGLLGVLVGRLGASLLAAITHLPARPAVAPTVTALAVAVGLGLAFGLYPAWRASRQSPIEPLRPVVAPPGAATRGD